MDPIKFNDTSNYSHMTVLGVNGVFTESYINGDTLPEGFYKYSLHGNSQESINNISCDVKQNHVGDFVTKEVIELGNKNTKMLTQDDWSLQSDKAFDFKEYFNCHLSIDCQIRNADQKKAMQMGGKEKVKCPPEHSSEL